MGNRVIRYTRRLARKSAFRGHREYVHVGCGKSVRVFHAPGKRFFDRSAAWVAWGLIAVLAWMSGVTALAAAPQSQPQAQPAPASSRSDLDQLMALLAQRKHGQVTYREKDHLSVLERPLQSSGVLIYDAPDHLEKKALKPRAESVVLDNGMVTVRRGHRTYHLDLSSHPQVAPYIDAIRATMAGDRTALERVFKVSFEGSLAHWGLGLVPLDPMIARGVRRIRIEGARDDVQSVEIDKPNGDRSVMTLGPPAPPPQK
jgi:hypothetical protein